MFLFIFGVRPQEYLPSPLLLAPLPSPTPGSAPAQHKFHLRTYFLLSGAYNVLLARTTLALFSSLPYSPPKSAEESLLPHLTNTCLQPPMSPGEVDESNVHLLWELEGRQTTTGQTLTKDVLERIWEDCGRVGGEAIKAAVECGSVGLQLLPNCFEVRFSKKSPFQVLADACVGLNISSLVSTLSSPSPPPRPTRSTLKSTSSSLTPRPISTSPARVSRLRFGRCSTASSRASSRLSLTSLRRLTLRTTSGRTERRGRGRKRRIGKREWRSGVGDVRSKERLGEDGRNGDGCKMDNEDQSTPIPPSRQRCPCLRFPFLNAGAPASVDSDSALLIMYGASLLLCCGCGEKHNAQTLATPFDSAHSASLNHSSANFYSLWRIRINDGPGTDSAAFARFDWRLDLGELGNRTPC